MSSELGPEAKPLEDGSANTFLNIAHDFIERVTSEDLLPEGVLLSVSDIDPPEAVVSDEDLQGIGQNIYATVELTSMLAKAYLAGRADQISDMHGSNETRTVKARNLSRVVLLSLMFDGTDAPERKKAAQDVTELFDEQRRVLDPATVGIAVSDEALAEQIAKYTESNPIGIYFFKKPGEEEPSFWWHGESGTITPRLMESTGSSE